MSTGPIPALFHLRLRALPAAFVVREGIGEFYQRKRKGDIQRAF
jgi:hypothetical protein